MKYVVTIEEPYLRDVQFYNGNPQKAAIHNPVIEESDDWGDVRRPQLLIGIFETLSRENARVLAAETCGYHPDILTIHEIRGDWL